MSKYESSPEWQAALIKLLEEMKAQGVDVDEVEANGVSYGRLLYREH